MMLELDLAFIGGSGDRCGVARIRGGSERNVALAGEQAGGRIEAYPAGARQVDFAPCVQVGEVDLGA